MMTQFLRRRIPTAAAAARLEQAACFITACLIPVLTFRKFAEIEMTDAELTIGVLATMTLAVLCAVLGLLLRSESRGSDSSWRSP
jgi:UPF0716 family protein affecting phage T7 exclusion